MYTFWDAFPHLSKIVLKFSRTKFANVDPVIFSYVLAQTTPFPWEIQAITRTYFPPVPQTLPLAVFERPSDFLRKQRPEGAAD